MAQGAGEEEDALQGQRDQEEVKVSVIPEPDTVTHPRAMVVEPEKEITFQMSYTWHTDRIKHYKTFLP